MYNKDFFDEKFENYNKIEGNAWRIHWRASQIHRMMKALECVEQSISNDKIPVSICEIGCASADFTDKYYKKNIMRIEGIDISEKAIEICKKKYKEDSDVNFIQGDLLDLKLVKTYDLVICMDVLHYYSNEEKGQAIRNIFTILNIEGKALLMIPLNDKSDAREFIDIISKVFKKISCKYVFTEFYQKYFEKKLLYVYDFLYSKEMGQLFLAKQIKKIVHSTKIFNFVNRFDIKRMPSHIIVVAEK